MDTQAFDLTAALGQWRARFTSLAPDDLAELEGHLLDSMAELGRTGLSDEEAFSIACTRLGNPAELAADLSPPPPVPTPPVAVPPPRSRARGCTAAASISFGVLLLVFAAATFAWSILAPKKYVARALIEVEGLHPGDPDTVTEYRAMTSRQVLGEVVKTLDLAKRWNVSSPDEAYQRLEEMIDADEERGTDLFRLTVYSTDRREAPELANAVAHAYANHKKAQTKERHEKAFEQAQRRLKEQQARVDAAREKMMALVERYKIVDLDPSGTKRGQGDVKPTDTLRQDAARIIAKKEAEIRSLSEKLAAVEGKTGEDLVSSGATSGLIDPGNSVYLQYLNGRTSLQSLRDEGRGPRHPDVVAMEKRVAGQMEVLVAMFESLRKNLEDNLRAAQAMVTHLRKLTDEKDADSASERAKYLEYLKARDDYWLQMELLEKMIEEQVKTPLILSMPKLPASIHELATEPLTYAKPNRALQFALAGAFALVGVSFIALGVVVSRRGR